MDIPEELTEAAKELDATIRSSEKDRWKRFLVKHMNVLPKLINTFDKDNRTPLMLATLLDDYDSVKRIVGLNGVKIDAENPENNDTALTMAVKSRKEKIAELLLERGANVNHRDKDGRTPLAWACCSNEDPQSINPLIKLLLRQKDINIEASDRLGRTPLALAAEAVNIRAVRILLGNSTKPIIDAQDHDGRTPLSHVVANTRHDKDIWLIAKLLLDQGANAEYEDKYRRSPVSYAVLPKIALLLLSGRISRRLIVCCDGTWNDQELKQPLTNVSRIMTCLEATDERHGKRYEQIPFYVDGIGTGKRSTREKTSDGIWGDEIDLKICEAYRFLCSAYTKESDQIVLIGFSRGSYTIQCLAKLIKDIGLIHKDVVVARLPEIYKAWAVEDGLDPFEGYSYDATKFDYTAFEVKVPKTRKSIDLRRACEFLANADLIRRNVKIRAYAAWDTVKSLRKGKFSFLEEQLPDNIEHAFHALALDERRTSFLPLILRSSGNLRQCWFRGSHSDIGGGNKNPGFADITLWWMISQLEDLVQFDKQAYGSGTNTGTIFRFDLVKENKDVPELAIYDPETDPEVSFIEKGAYGLDRKRNGPGDRIVGKNPAQELVHFTVRCFDELAPGRLESKSKPLTGFRIVDKGCTDPGEEMVPSTEGRRYPGEPLRMDLRPGSYEWHGEYQGNEVVIKEDRMDFSEGALLEGRLAKEYFGSAFAATVGDVVNGPSQN